MKEGEKERERKEEKGTSPPSPSASPPLSLTTRRYLIAESSVFGVPPHIKNTNERERDNIRKATANRRREEMWVHDQEDGKKGAKNRTRSYDHSLSLSLWTTHDRVISLVEAGLGTKQIFGGIVDPLQQNVPPTAEKVCVLGVCLFIFLFFSSLIFSSLFSLLSFLYSLSCTFNLSISSPFLPTSPPHPSLSPLIHLPTDDIQRFERPWLSRNRKFPFSWSHRPTRRTNPSSCPSSRTTRCRRVCTRPYSQCGW